MRVVIPDVVMFMRLVMSDVVPVSGPGGRDMRGPAQLQSGQ